jgi:hypothetical protein
MLQRHVRAFSHDRKESRALVSPLEVPKLKRAALLLHARRGSSWSCRRRSCMNIRCRVASLRPRAPTTGREHLSGVRFGLKRRRVRGRQAGLFRADQGPECFWALVPSWHARHRRGMCSNQVNPHFGTPSGRNNVSRPCREVSDVLLLLLRAMYE